MNREADWSNFTKADLSKGNIVRAFEEGRASGMQGLTLAACPYFPRSEPDQHDAWVDGLRSWIPKT